MSAFEELAKVDCKAYIEKKGKFSYLSWPFAFAELFKRHPKAEITVREWDGFPAIRGPKGWMVCVSVTIDGVTRSQWHPILDANNRAIAEPDVFQINTSIQRGAVKAIALHGLGLYIYAGEDLPEAAAVEADAAAQEAAAAAEAVRADWLEKIKEAADRPTLDKINAELKEKFKPAPVPPPIVNAWKARVVALAAN